MDPNATLTQWAFLNLNLEKISYNRSHPSYYGMMDDAEEAASNLLMWLSRGGFEPSWTKNEKAVFMAWCRKHNVTKNG